MNFHAGIKPHYSTLLVVSVAVVLFPMIFSTSIQAFRVAPENIAADNLRQIADNDLWMNDALGQAILLAEDNYDSRGGHKSSAIVDVFPYEAMFTVASIGLQPERGGNTANDMSPYFSGDVLYHHMYYRVATYFSILPIAVGFYCLMIGGLTMYLILIPKARTGNLLLRN